MRRFINKTIITVILGLCSACQINPVLPEKLNGQSLFIMGFTARESFPYEDGTLYTGMTIDTVNGEKLDVPLQRFDTLTLPPGQHTFSGTCYWRLRSMRLEDDLLEPAKITLDMKAETTYTLNVIIDEYKHFCDLSYVETPFTQHRSNPNRGK